MMADLAVNSEISNPVKKGLTEGQTLPSLPVRASEEEISERISPEYAQALSLERDVLPLVERAAETGEMLVLLLRKRNPSLNSEEQPADKASLGVLISGIASVDKDANTNESSLALERTIFPHMLKNDPVLKQKVLGRDSVLGRALTENGISESARESFNYVELFSGPGSTIKTTDDRLLQIGSFSDYEVVGVDLSNSSLNFSEATYKAVLISALKPSSSMSEKVAAMSYLSGDEESQVKLLRKIEPFYLTSSPGGVVARNGQFPQDVVEKFFSPRAQDLAYTRGMIAFPKTKIIPVDEQPTYSSAYARSIRAFYKQAEYPALKLTLERQHPALFEQKTSSTALLKHSLTVVLPEQFSEVSEMVSDKANDVAGVILPIAESVATRVSKTASEVPQGLERRIVSLIEGLLFRK